MAVTHVVHDVLRELIPCSVDGLILHDTSEGDHGDLCRTTTYIDDHVPFRSEDVYADTDSCCHRLIDHIYVTSPCVFARVTYGTYLYLCASGGDTDHHA